MRLPGTNACREPRHSLSLNTVIDVGRWSREYVSVVVLFASSLLFK